MGLLRVTLDGVVLDVNEALCRMLECTAEDVLGKSERQLLFSNGSDARDEDRAALVAGVTQSYRRETRLRRKSGHPLWVRETFSLIARGSPAAYVLTAVEDISERKRAEAELRESEARFRATFEQAAVGIAHVGLDGRWIRVNERLLEVTGYSREEMEARTFQDITHPDDLETDLAHMRELLDGVAPTYTMEKRYIRKDGGVVWVILAATLVRDEMGDPSYFIAVIKDITGRKQTETQLRNRSTELQGLVDTAPVAVWFLHLHNSGTLHANRYASDHLGVPVRFAKPGESGQTFRLLENGSELDATSYPISRALAGLDTRNRELQAVRSDGRVFLLLYNASPLRDDRGAIIGAISTAVDITSAKEAETGMREREARLQSILNTVPEALITINEQGVMESFSRSAEDLFGYKASEVLGQNVRMLMPQPYQHEHDEYLARYRRTGEKRIIGVGRVVRAQRKDGSVLPVELSVGEVRTSGRPVFTGFIRDLTAQHKIEQELRQAQKMEAIGQLTGGVAHDFNNLLTVILGNLEMLEPRLTENRQLELLKEARETAEHGARLTERLLAFGRRQALQPTLTDVGVLLREIVPVLRRTLGETIKVKIRLDVELWPVIVDPTQLHNAILNVAINARDAMPEGGKLTIAAENAEVDLDYARTHPEVRAGSYVVIAATDTGTGMSPEVQERAFEPFFTTKEVGAGSGLGLSMVYGFAKQSGGHVAIYSEPGHGTTLRIYLPRAVPAAAEPASESRVAEADLRRGRGELVLVVEDEPRVRRIAMARLQELGYRVLEAADGPSALSVLRSTPEVDLLFTDMIMPGGMTGAELARHARELKPSLKVLFTSGYAEPDLVSRGLISKSSWLQKPYSTAELSRSMEKILAS